ncbi:hypothetical protein SELMODRAFT_402996 [Selaginella moellendorffii]|uniref:Uncharacterized protein n=1 Tax=Selaginella moellendorffii TaxID=88036 RepID=D8QNQ5_SELML|nr:hypothetical protein SELMODRAFT_402996 [Selaginella moellendorffii]
MAEVHSSWEFLKLLPEGYAHFVSNPRFSGLISLKRDVGFVIAGPPLLLDSDELPIASISGLIGDCAAGWIEELDPGHARDWFLSRKSSSNTRLGTLKVDGDHFAKCVEFVLRFAPLEGIDSIFYSQQVLEPVTVDKDEEMVSTRLEGVDGEQTENGGDKYERRRARKLLRRLHRKRISVNTVGEFDFLFRLKHPQPSTVVEHWEVSVKFLLYVGPWEAFGLQTPEAAKWKQLRSEQQMEEISTTTTASRNERFLGFFLGPHVGETLADRKNRLKNQLTLPTKAAALGTLESLFGSGDIRVSSRALLHGYLFYEPALWKFLCTTSSDFRGSTYGDSTVNSRHWKGWWMNVEGFQTFASAPERVTSKWYIVPKMEWLSPVVIREDEERFLHGALSSDGLVDMAAKVAEEASRMGRDRMRRFMVAEIRRQSDECHWIWSESSRGFIVEDSWPDTKAYSPHGFVMSWGP